ncbi:ObirGr6 [Ooceraea biroi]|uniref:Gustatory receptor n=1 Tax=Ooceraea biroi TaxID=2015173 RepID=A0A026VVH7_OOCBI|nr:putative gustatory receptor 28b [Ooceraea biroi]EZA47645.1 hypothetical protein X777_15393 [Ooceraea biroi]RLU15143.1 ObirGr6 [Ooceraea biroi]
MFQPKSIHDMIMPLTVANFVLGMSIWSSKPRGKILNIMYSLFCLVLYCVLMRLSMLYLGAYNVHKANSLGDITFQAMFYVNIILTLCIIPTGWWNGKHMQAALTRILMCEKAVQEIGIQKNYRRLYLRQIYGLVSIALMFTVFLVINCKSLYPLNTPLYAKIILIAATHYPIALMYISDVSFLHWVRYSKIRFEQLNNVLQRMLTTTADSPQHKRVLKMNDEWSKTFITSASQQRNRRTKDNTDTMRAVKQVHLELVKASRTTNEAYGLQILFSMTISFVFITTLLYYAYTILWLDLSKEEFQLEMMPIVGWVIFYSSKVLVINHACSLTSAEAASTGDIICELYEPATSREFRAEIRDFTLQLIQNPLIFTACGFFTLDHTFIHGVIGSVTTYLVILIQVGDLSPNDNSTMLYSNATNFSTFNTLTADVYL